MKAAIPIETLQWYKKHMDVFKKRANQYRDEELKKYGHEIQEQGEADQEKRGRC